MTAADSVDPVVLARKIKIRRLAELEPYNRNARTHSEEQLEQLAASIREFGFVQPILARESGQIVAGHARLEAARRAGLDRVPVIVLDHLTEAQARALVLVDNRLAELGGWDQDLLAAELADLAGDSEALGLAWSAEELEELLAGAGEAGAELEPSDHSEVAPPTPDPEDRRADLLAKWKTEPGQVWQFPASAGGFHQLKLADSFEPGALLEFLEDAPAAVVITDPPYAIYGSSTGIASDISDDRIVRPFFAEAWRLIASVLPWHGHAYMFCDWRSWAAVFEGARAGGMTVKNCLVWDKGGAGLGANYANTYELLAFAHRSPPQKTMGGRLAGVRTVGGSNVLRHNRVPAADRWHNAAKPVPLLVDLIEASSNPGDLVVDPFLGSGSTLIAADRTGRLGRGFEVDPAAAANALERFSSSGFAPVLAE